MTTAELLKLTENYLDSTDDSYRRRNGGKLVLEIRDHLRDLLSAQNARVGEILDLTDVHRNLQVVHHRNSPEHHHHSGVVQGLRTALDLLSKSPS